MFKFNFEPNLALLTVTRRGQWTLQTVAAYEGALREELKKLQASSASTSFIIDIRLSKAQPKDVADELRAMVGRLGPLHAERTAVVTASGIAKLQALRIADKNAEVFTSIVLARDWVLRPTGAASGASDVHDEPSSAEAEGCFVHIHGPSDLDINLTPDAALQTAKRIGEAAIEALQS